MTAALASEVEQLGIDQIYDRIDQHVAEIEVARKLIEDHSQRIALLHERATRLIAAREARHRMATPEGVLTDAERRVAPYLRSSLSTTEIARELYVSPNTVKTHMKNIYRKVGAKTRAQAVAGLAGLLAAPKREEVSA